MIIAWKRLENAFLSYNKYKKSLWDKVETNLEACWEMLTFVIWTNDLILGLGLKAKKIRGDNTQDLIVSKVITVRLDIIAKLWQDIASFETRQVVTILERESIWEISNILLLKSKKNIESCTGKPQMRAICIYIGCTKVTTDYWDIRPSVTSSFIGYYLRNNWTDSYNQTCIENCSSSYL